MSDHAHAAPRAHHRNYVKIWAILTGLLALSVLGSMAPSPVIILTAAFGIALVKAYLVAKNFMHLDVEKPIVHWALATVLILMVLMYAGLAPDVQRTSGDRWTKTAGFHYMSAAAQGESVSRPAAGAGAAGNAGAPH